MCDVIIYPTHRRLGLIRKNARLAATYSPEGAERTIAALVRQQRSWMSRIAPPEVVQREMASLEDALRREMCRVSGGARQA